ncbi:pentapeptide repeat-containing protein [Aetokthonos hydrillicola Thurmond2011]|jgi:uncharacterized protein YjbI with pentapeptide repeats|uniref:Pentapeptide repeat-containing protein n=1 Tax=Aetokthonos hydrillicola Thurmond2011 TaxID=2712845 RepID=A0AAP5IEH6_9CYAN|nr:pentapeptide repeat-containing protein [Aetokthonos hydrillicola]MBO3461068.1 pentapeptide repeat-containing protein [Aetokthonos hydrillicola CCALA 1050]MBW4586322.1 pentapeptide repeat-containing protein [Aetokthonos hydrillicola CCALA 1050]MDR9897450.1 pentapeptide repeat-containing protein [Aetokthonos hydrillicola Thurmond2011]
MSAKKTDVLRGWLIVITLLFSLSPTVILLAFPKSQGLSDQEKIESRTQALATTATLFLGLAVMINAYYARSRSEAMHKNALTAEKNIEIGMKNIQLAQEHLIAERMMTAITQLGHHNVATRTGAIYTLERVAQDSPQEYWTVMEILTAFIRENTASRLEQENISAEDISPDNVSTEIETPKLRFVERQTEARAKIPTDIQAALTVIGRRNVEKDPKNYKLDLRRADLCGADLRQANLQKADLRKADLYGVDLREANLSGADLEQANLSGAILCEANLELSNLHEANLSGANLNRASVCNANLRAANLSGASIRAADLCDANLYKANLHGANLKVANLSGAKLFLANLQGAKLGKANLQGTGLIGANLQQANLNGANLQQANLNAAKLQHTEILFANLSEASMREADLGGANLIGTSLQRAILDEANFCGANLTAANLHEANLCDVKLDGAILTGVKNLEPHQITMALGDRTTRLPDNVPPPTHWMQIS